MTAQDLIDYALTEIGVADPGVTPATEERNWGLTKLNQLLSSWSAQALPIYQITRETFVLSGAGSYTIGTGQTWSTTRPVKIKAAAYTANGVIVWLDVVPAEVWADGGRNRILYYDHGYPNGTVWLRPAPTDGTLELYSYKPLTSFATLNTAIALPDGYERALQLNLAVDLAPSFGRALDANIIALANDAKMSIQGLNQAVLGPVVPGVATPPATQ